MAWAPALIGAAGSIIGGMISRRESREYMARNSITGRILEAEKHGINKLVAIGAQGSPYAGGAMGAGLSAASGSIADALENRRQRTRETQAQQFQAKEAALNRSNALAVAKTQANAQVRAQIERGYWDMQSLQQNAHNRRNSLILEHALRSHFNPSDYEARLRTEHEFQKEVRPRSFGDMMTRGWEWFFPPPTGE